MYDSKDIILAVDYHDENLVIRQFNCHTGQERLLKYRTTARNISKIVSDSVNEAAQVGGRVFWIMESTTGWPRVKKAIGSLASLVVANVLQMPLPPKAYRRKTDKIDTKRFLREFLNGSLPVAFQPPAKLREIRRLVAARESLVSRRTALRNWINRYPSDCPKLQSHMRTDKIVMASQEFQMLLQSVWPSSMSCSSAMKV